MTARAKLIVLVATTAFTATFGGVVLPVDAQDPASTTASNTVRPVEVVRYT